MAKEKHLKYKAEQEFDLIAISAREDAYRLSWVINNTLDINLQRAGHLNIWEEKLENPQQFVYYQYNKSTSQIVYRLISNKSETGFLSPAHKGFDYFLQLINIQKLKIDDITKKLMSQSDILAVKEIEKIQRSLKQKLII